MKASALEKYLDQLNCMEDEFAMQHSLDSSTWNLADAREVSNFYSSNLAYAKAVIRQAAEKMAEDEARIDKDIENLREIRDTIEGWKKSIWFLKEQAE